MLISELAGSALLIDGIGGIDGSGGTEGSVGPSRVGQPCWLG
jgi:hypothetical protein